MPFRSSQSAAALHERATRLANALMARGLKPGDRVGILSRNRIEYVEAYGVSGAGLIALPLNWRLSPRELQIVLTNAEPAALIVDPAFMPVIKELQSVLPFVRVCLGLDGGAEGFESYDEVVASGAPELHCTRRFGSAMTASRVPAMRSLLPLPLATTTRMARKYG